MRLTLSGSVISTLKKPISYEMIVDSDKLILRLETISFLRIFLYRLHDSGCYKIYARKKGLSTLHWL